MILSWASKFRLSGVPRLRRFLFASLFVALAAMGWDGCAKDSGPVTPLPSNPADTADAAFRSWSKCRFSLQGIELHQRLIVREPGPRWDTSYFSTPLRIDTTLRFERSGAYLLFHDSIRVLRETREDSLQRSLRLFISADSVTRTLDSLRWDLVERRAMHWINEIHETKELALFIRHLTPDPGNPSVYRMADKVKISNLCRPVAYTRHRLMHTFDSGDPEEWEETWSAETLPGAEISLTFLR